MDKTLNLKLDDFKKALDRLNESLQKDEDDIVRDSVIKRFEFTYELCWKSAKRFLNDKHGIDVFSPKEVFRELRVVENLSDFDTENLLLMTADRNAIVHTYREQYSKELYQKIKDLYYDLLKKVYEKLV